MASRRTLITRDRQRNSTARKNTHRSDTERAQQQAKVLAKLVKEARTEAKSAA
jgi:hypothetical protein